MSEKVADKEAPSSPAYCPLEEEEEIIIVSTEKASASTVSKEEEGTKSSETLKDSKESPSLVAKDTAASTSSSSGEVLQEWVICASDSRGVSTWVAPDGNVRLRLTYHPEDKVCYHLLKIGFQ